MTKVGMYNCLTKYHNYKDDGLLRQRINGSTYTKWEEIEPELSKNVENQYVNKYLL